MVGFVSYSPGLNRLLLRQGNLCKGDVSSSKYGALRLPKVQDRTDEEVTRQTTERVQRNNEVVIVVWLRLGDLRMHDNPALSAAAALTSTGKHCILPLLTLVQGSNVIGLNDAVVELGRSLQRRTSGLVVRFVSSERHARLVLQETVKLVRASRIFANRKGIIPENSCQSMDKELPLQLFDQTPWNGIPIPSPLLMPRLPRFAPASNFISLSTNVHSNYGEAAALVRLRTILASRNGLVYDILTSINPTIALSSMMRLELRLGCISMARISHEAGLAHSRCKDFVLASVGSGAAAVAAMSTYDVSGTDRRALVWDEKKKKFQLKEWEHRETNRLLNFEQRLQEFFRRRKSNLHHIFIPDDVTPDYYAFTFWRFSQRCVSATVGVFGTRALLLALGVKAGRIGQAAAISWVLKDGLGRVGKMLWAGSMGKDFDIDPKRWRFRSALLYACGNGLEIVTQIFPASFLVLATLANSMKQVSMLTASATRNAMYRSFGERSQNIANITAKGEAQIVIADLIGMASGIKLTQSIGSSRSRVLAAYLGLTGIDLFGIYMELRAVVFRSLNAERTNFIVQEYIHQGRVPEPEEISPRERIFLRPKMIRRNRFQSLQKAVESPEQLASLMSIFKHEKFMISCGSGDPGKRPCKIVMRKDASNEDVMRAIFVAGHFQEQDTVCDSPKFHQALYNSANKEFPRFYQMLRASKWNTENMLYSTVKRRAAWGHAARR